MKVAFKREVQLEINMSKLLDECIDRLDYVKKQIERGDNYIIEYESLEYLVQESLEFLYDIDLHDYYNTYELLTDISKSLLALCLKYGWTEEYNRLRETR